MWVEAACVCPCAQAQAARGIHIYLRGARSRALSSHRAHGARQFTRARVRNNDMGCRTFLSTMCAVDFHLASLQLIRWVALRDGHKRLWRDGRSVTSAR